MNTFENTNTFFNTLRLHAGAIWVEEGEIKFSAPKKFQNKETNDFIVSNKPQIINILQKNDISSAKNFLNQKIFRDETQSFYPLSPAQERLWFIEQYEEGTNAYHLPAIYEVELTINKEGINYAVQQVIARHEILRSTIEQGVVQGHGVQIVHNKPLSIEDVTLLDTDDYDALIKEDVNQPFDLSKEYPIRVKFYTINSSVDNSLTKILLLVNTHHIASDGWSIDIFQKELYAYYDTFMKKDTAFSLPALTIQYRDYALWQKSYLTEDTLEKQLSFWKNKLEGYQTLEFPTDYTRPNQVDYKGAYHEFEINAEISHKLRELAQRNGASLNSVMLSSINILLSKYTGQDDIVIGTVMANRHHRQTEELIGFFANTQANRAVLSTSQSFTGLIQQIHEEQTQAQLHQDFPFEKLVVELGVERDASRHPVFQVMFGVQSFGNENNSSEKQKNFFNTYQSEHIYESEKFDFTIFVDDSKEALFVQISYATSLFTKNTIVKLGSHFVHLLDQLTVDPNKHYSEISLLDPTEYKQIVLDWNATEKEYLKNKTIHQLFEEQVLKTPNAIALVYGSQKLSYKELNEKSNQLACFIRTKYQEKTNQTLKPDTLIALYLNRSLEMIIGILAVLKAGGAYVPMDPSYPQERIDYLLNDSNAELILSRRNDKNSVKLPEDKVVYIDLEEGFYTENDGNNMLQNCFTSDLAYVIYTSGTTGKPKGVMVEHKAFSQFIYNFNDRLKETINLTEGNVLSLTNYVFDIFGLEYALPLITGNRITLSTIDQVTKEEVLTHQIIQQTPATLFQLADKYPDDLASAVCLVGGEALTPAVAKKIIPAFNKVINVYGPAETVIWSSSFEMKDENQILIGTPLMNEKMYVLDTNMNPVPVGIIGELYIGGAGLARGYLNREELTQERFISNPFATNEDKLNDFTRLYKTGDLVRWLPNGKLEYIGRNDDQVKIRGYRIELGEVENALAQIEGIQKACVLVKEKKTSDVSNKYLVGYYVKDTISNELEETFLQKELSKILPEYMLPSLLVAMDSFPLTINGKLNRRAFPDTELGSSETVYIAPETQLEIEVCEIWKQLLGSSQVGVTSDFFRMGGNSILAIQVSHQMSKLLESHVKVADVFKNKTIRAILETCAIEEVEEVEYIFTDKSVSQYPLSVVQERLWLFEQAKGGSNTQHLPQIYELDVAANIDGIKYALTQIVSRHEILRTTIEQKNTDKQYVQVVNEDSLSFESQLLTDVDDYMSIIKKDIHCPFKLGSEYPIRVNFYTITSITRKPTKTFVLINIHFIAHDGWSYDIFQKELFSFYEAYTNDDPTFSLPSLQIQYKDYALWQQAYLKGEVIEKQLNYWKNKLIGYKRLELPTDFPRPSEINYDGAEHVFKINKKITEQLHEIAKFNGVTLNSVMLSSVNILLGKYTGQDDIVIGRVMANRHHWQTKEVIGAFANRLANRTILKKQQSFNELVQQVHQDQIEAQLNQDLPIEKIIEALQIEHDSSRHPIFQVMFSVQDFGNEEKYSKEQQNFLKPLESEGLYEIEKFDLSIFIDDYGDDLSVQLGYFTSLFHKDTIENMAVQFLNLLELLIQSPDKAYSQFSLLPSLDHSLVG